MITDIGGNMINDLYCDDFKYKQELLHLCIFPLENASLITMFTHKSNKRYRKFKTQFLKLSLADKLSVVNYLLFLYTEDMFLSGHLDIKMIDTVEFEKVIRTNPTDSFSTISPNALKTIVNKNNLDKFSLGNHKLINNLLSEEFSMEKLSNLKH